MSATVDGRASVYGYDAAGQLVEMTTAEGTTTLACDAAGRRLSETGPATVTGLWWDPLPAVAQVARIRQGGGGPLDLVSGHGRAYALDPAGTPAVFATDHLGSQRATAATAGLTAAAGYSPFGQPHAPPDPATVTFGYRGELHTGGLVHLRHRDYHPATGTLLTVDPLDGVVGSPTVVNGYHYAHNDPLRLVDPLGLRPWSDADARCWLLHGTCTEVLGDIDQASRGVIDTFGGMVAGSWDLVRDPASVAEAFEQAHREAGGGWRGRYEAANLLNPVYHVLVSGDACLQANHGTIDVRAAAAACTEFTITTTGTAAGTAATARTTTTSLRVNQATARGPTGLPTSRDQVAPAIDYDNVALSGTVRSHLDDIVKSGPYAGERTRPYLNSRLLVEEITTARRPTPNPGGLPNGWRREVPGTFRGQSGTWNLVVDFNTNQVVHFLFAREPARSVGVLISVDGWNESHPTFRRAAM